MQKQKNQKQIVYADVAIHDMPEKVSYKAKENREIKNSILVDLFYNDENAEENDIALYNALHEEPLPEGTGNTGSSSISRETWAMRRFRMR